MANKRVWKSLAGLAIASAAIGGAIAYAKRCKEVHDLAEEDFDDLEDSMEPAAPQEERTYTTLPTDSAVADHSEPTTEETEN